MTQLSHDDTYTDDNVAPGDVLLERDVVGIVQPTKYDGTKVRTDLFPVRAKIEIDKVFHYGSIVYAVGNWKVGEGFDWSRLICSAERHLQEFKLGVDHDPESRLPVLAHLGCCVAMLLEHFLTGHGKDTRSEAQITNEMLDTLEPLETLLDQMEMPEEVIAAAYAKRARVQAKEAARGALSAGSTGSKT